MKKPKKRWKIFWKRIFSPLLIGLIISLYFLGGPDRARGQEVQYHWIEKTGEGWIDWTSYSVSASINGTMVKEDHSYLSIMKTQKLEVMNRVFTTFSALPLAGKRVMGNIWTQETKKFLWGEINNHPDFSFVNTSENSTTITLTMPVSSIFLQKAIPLALYLKIQNKYPVSAEVGNSTTNDFVGGFTGLIIQVSTPVFSPSLFVYIYSQQGELLYGPASMPYRNFIHNHMAIFLAGEDPLLISKRVGNRPLVLSSQETFKNNVHTLVLDSNNSFYFKFKGILPLLSQGRIIIMKKPKFSINRGVEEFNLNN